MTKLKILLFLLPLFGNAQDIELTNKKFITLLFDSNITTAIVGNNDYILEYSTDENENIALLKAISTKAKETSLVVKTSNGLLFNINIIR